MVKPLEIIENKLAELLGEKGYVCNNEAKYGNEKIVLVEGGANSYAVQYDKVKKVVSLHLCTVNEDKSIELLKSMTQWLFDENLDTEKDVEGMANDFAELIEGPKSESVKAIMQQPKKKKKGEDDERNVDPLFFFNRLVGFFPELKEEMNKDKIKYGKLRYAYITKSYIAPLIEKHVKTNPSDLKKLVELFNAMYDDGDLDVRGILTHGLLNSMDDESIEIVKEEFSEDLAKVYKCSRPLKDKKIKPEKIKKKKKDGFMAKAREQAMLEQQRKNKG